MITKTTSGQNRAALRAYLECAKRVLYAVSPLKSARGPLQTADIIRAKEQVMGKLKVGDKAPSFSLEDQNGRTVSLADFRGTKLLLYFYPKADTPGCTRQACSVRDSAELLQEAGAAVVGISPDEPQKQKNFDDKYDLRFPLLSDPDHQVAEAYGAWGKKSLYGKSYEGIIRSSFLIDEDGKVLQATYGVKPEDTVPKAQEVLT
jgi:peroxiredoxin Q/BCP